MLTSRAKAILEKRYECKTCQKAFPSNWHLRIHSRMHTGVKPFECADCGLRFARKDYLEKHTRGHTGEKPFKCEVCGKAFAQRGHLQYHFPIHTDEKPYVCEFCGKSFLVQSNLRQHVSIHTNEKQYSCAVCGKFFREKRHIKIHLQTHLAVKPFICEFCGKSFLLKSNLKLHVVHHKGETLFVCDVCGKTFVDKSNLQRHSYIHTGEQPFTCNICGKSSSRKEFLKDHSLIHAGEKPYACTFCDEKYRFRTNLRQHMRHKHEDLLSNTITQVTNKTEGDTSRSNIILKNRIRKSDSSVAAKPKRTKNRQSACTSSRKSKSETVCQNVEIDDYSNHILTPIADDTMSSEANEFPEKQIGNDLTCTVTNNSTPLSYGMVVLPEEKTNDYSVKITPAAVNDIISEMVRPPKEKEFSVTYRHSDLTKVQESDFDEPSKISENSDLCEQFAVVGFLRKINNESPEITQSAKCQKIPYICGHCNATYLSSTEFDRHIQTHLGSNNIFEEQPYLRLLLAYDEESRNLHCSQPQKAIGFEQ